MLCKLQHAWQKHIFSKDFWPEIYLDTRQINSHDAHVKHLFYYNDSKCVNIELTFEKLLFIKYSTNKTGQRTLYKHIQELFINICKISLDCYGQPTGLSILFIYAPHITIW